MTNVAPTDTTAFLAAWEQWRERCAAGRCDEGVRRRLSSFAGRRAGLWWERVGAGHRFAPPKPDDAWHRFETHLVTSRTRAGRAYKAWLFARAEGLSGVAWLDAICGSATLVMRDVVRDWFRREMPLPAAVSLNTPVPGTDGLTLADLISGGENPAAAAAARDLDAAAWRLAAGVFAASERPARVGLCLRALGHPLYGPAAERMARCGKTKLNAAVRKFARALAEDAMRTYGGDGRNVAKDVAMRAMTMARDLAVRWGRAEKRMAPAFQIVAGPSRARRGAARSIDHEKNS